MKKYALILAVALFCFGCDGEVKVDEKKIDEAGDKLQKTVEKGADSVGAKLERLKDKLDNDSTLKK
jgi:PBP1b-binding outer membrane lipoprotein LpoB